MIKETTINDRIKLIVETFANGKNTLLAKRLDVSEANIRGYLNNVQPKADFLQKIVLSLEISPDWLLTGRGEMERAAGCAVEGVSIQGNNTIAESTINNVRGGGAPCCEGCEMVRMLRTQIETQNTQINKLLDVIHENGKRD